MPRPKNKVPRLLRNQSAKDKAEGRPGRAFCVVNGCSHYFGPYGSELAEAAYHKFLAEYIAAGYRMPVPIDQITIAELCAAYWRHAKEYYFSEGERFMIKGAVQSLSKYYGSEPVTAFSPLKVEVLINQCIADNLSRTGVNHRLNRIKRLFKWGIAKDMVPPDIYTRVQAIPGLRRGRSAAKEGRVVMPPPECDVDAVVADRMTTTVLRAMITVQRHCGARAGEMVGLRPSDIDTSGPVWEARLTEHKTAFHGHNRTLYLGPECQAALRPLMLRPADQFLFSPAESELEHRAMREKDRTIPLDQGNRAGTNRKDKPLLCPGEKYTVASYRRALNYACKRAKVTPFSSHQLRHLAATNIRAKHGVEAAQVILGHRNVKITEHYALQDANLARRVASEML